MNKLNCIILRNEDPFDHLLWINACEDYTDRIAYIVVDLTRSDWFSHFHRGDDSILLTKPSGKTWLFRELYEERLEILADELGYSIFPSLPEIKIYENKRYFTSWALANKIPHPTTRIFYNQAESLDFINDCNYPQVGKLNIGASGNGIQILHDFGEAKTYINKAFNEGIISKVGPKLRKGKLLRRLIRKLTHPAELKQRIKTYKAIGRDRQQGFIILQEYIEHQFEWRVVRIGDSFFAHKKLKLKEKASGSLLKNYDSPPLKLLDFVKQLTDNNGMYSLAVDIFEVKNGKYLVNEMQCIFGQSDPYQMLVDGKPGRFRHIEGQWIFEEGDFAKNACYNLRLEYLLKKQSIRDN